MAETKLKFICVSCHGTGRLAYIETLINDVVLCGDCIGCGYIEHAVLKPATADHDGDMCLVTGRLVEDCTVCRGGLCAS